MLCAVGSIICIAILAAIFLLYAVRFFTLDRSGRITFIKGFKKGKGFLVYLAAYPLCFFAEYYETQNIGHSLFSAINDALSLIVVKFDFSTSLYTVNPYFHAAILFCLTLVAINSFMLTASVLYQRVANGLKVKFFGFGKDDKCIIIGNDATNKMIYNSCPRKKIIVGVFPKSVCDDLFVEKIAYKSFADDNTLYKWLNKKIGRLIKKYSSTNKKLNVIVNQSDEKTNLGVCARFISFINGKDELLVDNVDVYVFGDREYENIYAVYEKKSRGCLHYVNAQRQIAINLIDEYPLTRFMNEKQIDYKTSLLRPEADINVIMVGFGKVNQQLFTTSVSNNQFLTTDENDNIVLKPVKYYLFDKKKSGYHKNLNHSFFRYSHGFFADGKPKIDTDKYLPLPPAPAMYRYYETDVNSPEFYDKMKSALSIGDVSKNYVIVALGNDYQNADIANKLVAKIREWELKNVMIFVRIRDRLTYEKTGLCLSPDICVPFGNEKDAVYDYCTVTREKFTEMAITRNFCYDIEHDMKHFSVNAEEKFRSRMAWHIKRSTIEKESNVYACLSLRQKLNLMGLDCVPSTDSKIGIGYDEFIDLYAADDRPNVVISNDGISSVRYNLEYKDSRRKNLAILEHYRWNAFMIVNGFIPASLAVIKTEKDPVTGKFTNGKNYEIRRHGNLTTFDGLSKFREIISERDGIPETEADVIKYDYQLLDGAWQLLQTCGYKIVKL